MIRLLVIAIIFFSCNTSKQLQDNNNHAPVNINKHVQLDGSKSYDPDGYIIDWTWKQIAGPSTNIANPKAVITTTTLSKKGNYSFELIVTDNDGGTGRDTAVIKY